MSLTCRYPMTLSRADFDRLFTEALPYISIEKVRLGGEDALKEALWQHFEGVIPGTQVGGYYELVSGSNSEEHLVGAIAGGNITYNGETYFWLQTPLWGSDQNGSHSWWYSEDARRMQRDHLRDNGYVGTLCIYNPGSPAGNAVFSNFADSWDGRQYFEEPVQAEVEDVFGVNVIANISPTMKVVIARVRN